MKPALVLQHLVNDGPAYLGTWLAARGLAMDCRCTEAGQAFPADVSGHAALAVLGGAMSANDPLPSLRQAEALILDAMARGVPVIGHCLGGQLMARALGASVHASPRPEVGWQALTWSGAAADWFGPATAMSPAPEVFQWHYEAFDLPRDATWLAGNAACPQQAFAVGPHLGMQFHVEVDAAKLEAWADDLDEGYFPARAEHPDEVQSPEQMREQMQQRLAAQQRLADQAYRRWWEAAKA
jgi:GMP synthase-like glutamine amidotransferase